jgi:Ca2+-binding EF-hand superfamily protein
MPTTPSATASSSSSATLRQTFERFDANRDQQITRAEAQKGMEATGIGTGLLGGKKVGGATDALMDNFDADKNGNVSLREFARGGKRLAPSGMPFDPQKTGTDPRHIDDAIAALYGKADGNNDGAISRAELTSHQAAEASRRGESFATARGEVAATVTMHNLDKNRDGSLQKGELRGFLQDVSAEFEKVR